VGRVAAGLLLEALLRGRGARLFGVRRAGVGAEDEDRLGAGQQHRVAVQRRLRVAGELERLQLGGDREGEEAEQDPAERRQAQPLQHSPRAAPRQVGKTLLAGPLAVAALAVAGQLRRSAALAQAREIGPAQPAEQPLPGSVDLVIGRPGGLLLAVLGHKGLEIMPMPAVVCAQP